MKRIVLLSIFCLFVVVKAKTQVVLNEIYTDPGAGKHEFFEFYNTSSSSTPMSLDHYTIVTFFEITGKKGFYVLDLPNLYINPQGYFVGSSAIPFNYQGITNSTASDFSWNDPLLTTNGGYMRKWVEGNSNLLDGNLNYDIAPLPINFNDFFFRRTAAGASYSIFVYKNGQLINTFIGGTGGNATVINTIVNMPALYIDMLNPASTDFSINWSIYGSIPLEYCTQDAGSDNGYIRELDGVCALWDKSSAGVQHTPKQTNGGTADGYVGQIAVSMTVTPGTLLTGSNVTYDVVSAPAGWLPAELMIYLDLGSTPGILDPGDQFVESNIVYSVADPAITTHFFPYNANVLLVVKSSAGCLDHIRFLANAPLLSARLESFSGNRSENTVMLNWTVLCNEWADRYTIEKSENGKDFTAIATIISSNKIGSEVYGLVDQIANGKTAYYRLKTTGKSQAVEYSRILVFSTADANDTKLSIINNPVNDKLTLKFNSTSSQQVSLAIYDMTGRKLMEKTIMSYNGSNVTSMNLPVSMKSGMYVAELRSAGQRLNSQFVKL